MASGLLLSAAQEERMNDLLRVAPRTGPGLAFVFSAAVAASHAFLLIFAGMLFGVLLDACVRGIGYVLPLPRPATGSCHCFDRSAARACNMVGKYVHGCRVREPVCRD
jgi:hypothetical protein